MPAAAVVEPALQPAGVEVGPRSGRGHWLRGAGLNLDLGDQQWGGGRCQYQILTKIWVFILLYYPVGWIRIHIVTEKTDPGSIKGSQNKMDKQILKNNLNFVLDL